MRNASFIHTKQQVRDRTKDITRRLNWLWAKPGMRIQACEKCQGRRNGEPLVKLAVIEIVSVRREKLNELSRSAWCPIRSVLYPPLVYTEAEAIREVQREGFPEMSPAEFVAMFCVNMKCKPDALVTRVEFKYV
jgi:hypothetical protein